MDARYFRRQLLLVFGGLVAVCGLALVSLGRLGDIDDARSHMAEAPRRTRRRCRRRRRHEGDGQRRARVPDDRRHGVPRRDRRAHRKIRAELAQAGKRAPEAEDAAAIAAITAKFDAWAKALDAEFEL